MTFRRVYIFLTLVLVLTISFAPLLARAAKSPAVPELDERPVPPPPAPSDGQTKLDSVDISPAPPPPPPSEMPHEYFHKARRALTLRGGVVYDSKAAADGTDSLSVLGAQYLFYANGLQSFEVGADLLSDGSGLLHAARRFIFSTTRFRPFTKAGIGVRVVPSDQLVTLLRYENYQLRGSVGFETLIHVPVSLRVEFEAAASIHSIQGDATLGVVWAW